MNQSIETFIKFANSLPEARMAELEMEIAGVMERLETPIENHLSADWEAEVTRRLNDPKRRLATEQEVAKAFAAFSRPR